MGGLMVLWDALSAGLMVQKVRMLKSVDLPTLGRPERTRQAIALARQAAHW